MWSGNISMPNAGVGHEHPAQPRHLSPLLADLRQRLYDIHGSRWGLPDIYAPDDYRASQALGKRLRAQNSCLK
jgi:hypothetical protein